VVRISTLVCETSLMSVCQDNNDGITVFDVTDPEKASYCFVSILYYGDEEQCELPLFIPLNAKEYVRSYYAEPDRQNDEALSTEQKGEAKRTRFFYLTH
jgi:hypothetical protein